MFCTCGGGLAIDFVQITMQIYEKKSKVSKRKSSFCFAMIKKCANFAKLTKKDCKTGKTVGDKTL